MIRRPPRSTLSSSSAASDVYKRQVRGGMRSLRCCCAESVGGRSKHLCALLMVVSLAVLLVIMMLPRLRLLPLHALPFHTSPSSSTKSHGNATHWGRLAAFYILTGHKGDHYISAVLAETAGDCRSLPTNATSSACQRPVDIYLLYSSEDELTAVQEALNTTRY